MARYKNVWQKPPLRPGGRGGGYPSEILLYRTRCYSPFDPLLQSRYLITFTMAFSSISSSGTTLYTQTLCTIPFINLPSYRTSRTLFTPFDNLARLFYSRVARYHLRLRGRIPKGLQRRYRVEIRDDS